MQELIVYDVHDIMERFGLNMDQAYRLMTSAGFPVVYLNKTPYVSAAALDRWMSSKTITKGNTKK